MFRIVPRLAGATSVISSFADLLSITMYGKYLEAKGRGNGPSFMAKYMKILEAGSSKSTAELLATLDIDINDPHWVDAGFAEFGRLVEMAEKLVESK